MFIIKRLVKYLLYIIIAIALVFGGLLAYSTFTDYKPEPTENLSIDGKGEVINGTEFSFMIWNIGYAGLGKEMDFFNDGGKSVRASKELSDKYLTGISGFLAGNDSIDFILLQEVDKDSKRSYNVNQEERLASGLPGFSRSFALNYDCKFVPVPFQFPYEPYGKTYGGLLSFSRFTPVNCTRYQYPGGFSWPTSLYMLDRCMQIFTYKLPNGKELEVINTHNTAYDETGEIKKTEMEYIKKFLDSETAKGNYVVMGGDWNQAPPGFDALAFNKNVAPGYTVHSIDSTLLPKGWKAVYDPSTPTNRANKTEYRTNETFTTLIDFFIVSPNIEVETVKTIDLGFVNSDHQPVYLKVKLKN